jgi:hypothetical protein
MGERRGTATGPAGLLSRLRSALTARRTASAQWHSPVRSRAGAGEGAEHWVYFPQVADGGYHRIEVRTCDGYGFARLDWLTCSRCRLALVAKIRVTDGWQHRGYAVRMLARAMRGRESYAWVTTPQSPMGRPFFAAAAKATGAGFTRGDRCAHMRAAGTACGNPQPELASPAAWGPRGRPSA